MPLVTLLKGFRATGGKTENDDDATIPPRWLDEG